MDDVIQTPNAIAHVVSVLWYPLVGLLIYTLGARRAATACVVIGYLFLPHNEYDLPWIAYEKNMAIALGLGLCYLAILGGSKADLPERARFGSLGSLAMLAVILCPLASGMSNELTAYDTLNEASNRALALGIPYLIGRRCITDLRGAKELANALVLGALVYVPLCFLEMRLSPFLHVSLYGYHQHTMATEMRYGFFRPMVFLTNGIVNGYWMACGALVAFWLWRTGATRRLLNLSTILIAGLLGGTALLCRSLSSIVLVGLVGATLQVAALVRHRIFLLALMLVPPIYFLGPMVGADIPAAISELAGQIDPARRASFEFRLQQEVPLKAKAMEKPILGWGGWGRGRVYDEETGRDLYVTDSLWIVEFGKFGLASLAAIYLAAVAPAARLFRVVPPRAWTRSQAGPAIVLATLPLIMVIDGLANSIFSPVMLYIMGAVDALSTRAARGGLEDPGEPASPLGPAAPSPSPPPFGAPRLRTSPRRP